MFTVRQLRDVAVTVCALAVLGVAAGVLWSWLAPRAPYATIAEGTVLADPTSQALIGADGWFAVVTGVAGLVCGAVAYRLSRREPLAVLLGLAGGSALAAALTLWVGRAVDLGPAQVAATSGTVKIFSGPLVLTAPGVMVMWPLLAVGVFFACEAVVAYRDSPLRRPFGEEQPYGPLSPQELGDK